MTPYNRALTYFVDLDLYMRLCCILVGMVLPDILLSFDSSVYIVSLDFDLRTF